MIFYWSLRPLYDKCENNETSHTVLYCTVGNIASRGGKCLSTLYEHESTVVIADVEYDNGEKIVERERKRDTKTGRRSCQCGKDFS
jgi:hypothetical protein